jgi:ribonuclease HII
MVYAGCLVELADEAGLRAAGVRDSKKVSRKKRAALRPLVEETACDFAIVPLAPDVLDATSLNELGKRVLVDLTVRLKPDILVFDAPVPPRQIPGYLKDLRARLVAAGVSPDLPIIGENGADDTYPCCSAASILAKTERDAILAQLEDEAGEPLGSGYPGDRITVDWLERSYHPERGFPHFVRTKWETARRIVAAHAQGSLF